MTVTDTRAIVSDLMHDGQRRLCAAFEEIDNQGHFVAESWERPGGGGGTARVMTEGAVFERAGVNVSAVYGAEVPPSIWQHRPSTRGQPYFATGISLVLHPRNPYVPAFHANFRYFEAGEDWWFGGGMDLTPNYGFVEDARHFHVTLRDYCDRHPIASYAEMKAACDNYFFLKHRNEMRGIGGIFFDDLHPAGEDGFERAFTFVRDGITTILNAYLPIVRRRMNTPYGERERMWQLYRRGRYVEFNLIYDRGTLFGLQTGGNIEAILMSLPPLARWQFKYQPEPGSPEAAMAEFLKPRDWASETES